MPAEVADGIEQRVAWDFIRYGNCWEDADVLCAALQPCAGKRILSVCSAGDNVLSLVAEGADVVVADLNATQLACLELRCAAFRSLSHEELLTFLGVCSGRDRCLTYTCLADQLSPSARLYWDTHPETIEAGIIHGGKLEAYFRTFRRRILPWIHSRRTLDALLEPKTGQQREEFWNSTWNNLRWRMLFRLFFSRTLMGRLGRDPEFFRYVEGSVAERILDRTQYALTVLPTHENPYLEYLAKGNFRQNLPRYLRPEYYDRIRDGLHRLTWDHGPIEVVGRRFGADGYDGMNLSDIFEYLDEQHTQQLYGNLLALCRPKARLVYWNTLVPRSCPAVFRDRVEPQVDLASELFAADKAFFYNAFYVDQVIGPPTTASAT